MKVYLRRGAFTCIVIAEVFVNCLFISGLPRMGKLEIEGRGFHTNLYAVRGIYSGGKEGKSRIQWLRSMVGSPDLISIPGTVYFWLILPLLSKCALEIRRMCYVVAGETGRMYEANVDDVGYRLVALYTPVREDGVEGQPVSVSTELIAVGNFRITILFFCSASLFFRLDLFSM